MTIAARLEKLDERERRLLGALGGVAAVLLLLVLPVALLTTLWSKQSENDDIRAVLTEIDDARSTINERKARAGAVLAKYSNPAPAALAGFIEQAAKAHNLTAADTQDKADTPHGKLYNERYTVVKMHKISLLPFVQMLEQIESSGHPVAVSRFNIRPRPNEPDQYEVEVGISAYDRKETKPAAGAAASAEPSAAPGEEEAP